MHINTLLHHLFLHRTAQQARHYLCFSRVCLYAQRGGRMCGCEALKCESLRKLSEILRRTPIVYRSHGPKFRKPRHCLCHRPQSKQKTIAEKLVPHSACACTCPKEEVLQVSHAALNNIYFLAAPFWLLQKQGTSDGGCMKKDIHTCTCDTTEVGMMYSP